METLNVHLTLKLQNQDKLVSFHSPSRIALIGPSGCGKSSLVKVLVGVSDQGAGKFLFNDQDLMLLKPWEREIGYTPQDLILLPHLSVRDNLLFPVRNKIDPDLNEGLGITPLLDRMPRHLSGGEKQRVALARALSGRSRLLILDEPFSSLDFKNKQRIVNFVDEYCAKKNLPLIFISHDEREIEELKCDRYVWGS